jgi:hypothetical protein
MADLNIGDVGKPVIDVYRYEIINGVDTRISIPTDITSIEIVFVGRTTGARVPIIPTVQPDLDGIRYAKYTPAQSDFSQPDNYETQLIFAGPGYNESSKSCKKLLCVEARK